MRFSPGTGNPLEKGLLLVNGDNDDNVDTDHDHVDHGNKGNENIVLIKCGPTLPHYQSTTLCLTVYTLPARTESCR